MLEKRREDCPVIERELVEGMGLRELLDKPSASWDLLEDDRGLGDLSMHTSKIGLVVVQPVTQKVL